MLKRFSFLVALGLFLNSPSFAEESPGLWDAISSDIDEAFADNKTQEEIDRRLDEYFDNTVVLPMGVGAAFLWGHLERAVLWDEVREIPELKDDVERVRHAKSKVQSLKLKADSAWKDKASSVNNSRNSEVVERFKELEGSSNSVKTDAVRIKDSNWGLDEKLYSNPAEESRKAHLALQEAEEELKSAKAAPKKSSAKYIDSQSFRKRLKSRKLVYAIRVNKWYYAGLGAWCLSDLLIVSYCATQEEIESPIKPTTTTLSIVGGNIFESAKRTLISNETKKSETKKNHPTNKTKALPTTP